MVIYGFVIMLKPIHIIWQIQWLYKRKNTTTLFKTYTQQMKFKMIDEKGKMPDGF